MALLYCSDFGPVSVLTADSIAGEENISRKMPTPHLMNFVTKVFCCLLLF
jgi:hypothetical protein